MLWMDQRARNPAAGLAYQLRAVSGEKNVVAHLIAQIAVFESLMKPRIHLLGKPQAAVTRDQTVPSMSDRT